MMCTQAYVKEYVGEALSSYDKTILDRETANYMDAVQNFNLLSNMSLADDVITEPERQFLVRPEV